MAGGDGASVAEGTMDDSQSNQQAHVNSYTLEGNLGVDLPINLAIHF